MTTSQSVVPGTSQRQFVERMPFSFIENTFHLIVTVKCILSFFISLSAVSL